MLNIRSELEQIVANEDGSGIATTETESTRLAPNGPFVPLNVIIADGALAMKFIVLDTHGFKLTPLTSKR